MPRTARVDAVDRRIVAALQRDGRRPFTSIARDLGISEAAVRQRVARLKETLEVLRLLWTGELVDYEGYNGFDSGVFNFQVPGLDTPSSPGHTDAG